MSSSGEGLMKLLAELSKRAETQSFPDTPHQVKVEVEVMDGEERRRRHLSRGEQMPEVGPAEMAAGVAAAVGVGRQRIFGVPGVLDHEHAVAGQQLAVAGVPGRQDAIEHVDAPRDAL